MPIGNRHPGYGSLTSASFRIQTTSLRPVGSPNDGEGAIRNARLSAGGDEGTGFELPVPGEMSSGFEASAELRPIHGSGLEAALVARLPQIAVPWTALPPWT